MQRESIRDWLVPTTTPNVVQSAYSTAMEVFTHGLNPPNETSCLQMQNCLNSSRTGPVESVTSLDTHAKNLTDNQIKTLPLQSPYPKRLQILDSADSGMAIYQLAADWVFELRSASLACENHGHTRP